MYLNCKTYFSLRFGTMSTKALVKAAMDSGVQTLALTNINGTCDTWDFVQACREEGIKPIAGVEIRNDDTLLYILLAANNVGLGWINEFLSTHLLEEKPFPTISTKPFFDHSDDGFVIYPKNAKAPENLHANERICIRPSEANKLFGTDIKKQIASFIILQSVTFLDKTHYNVHRL